MTVAASAAEIADAVQWASVPVAGTHRRLF